MVNLYPEYIHKGDLTPGAAGNPHIDQVCERIHDACQGFGTDEKALLQAMGSMNGHRRCKVPVRYQELYKKELKQVIKSECGSKDFGTALQLLAVPPDVMECDIIMLGSKGLGTDEGELYPVICGRSNEEMQLLKKRFFDLHTKDLGQVLDKELGGNLEQLVINVMQAAEEHFDAGYHTKERAKQDAEALHDMGQGRWGTNEKGLFKLLCKSPPQHLKHVDEAYADKFGYTLFKALEKELGGHVRDAALFTLGMKIKPYRTVAGLIHKTCKGMGTNELLLSATLIRYQSILDKVNHVYVEEYGKTLSDVVKSETRGNYEKLLLEVIDVKV